MKHECRRKPFWIAVVAIAAVGVAVLVVWSVTRDRFPEGSLFVPRDVATLSEALRTATEGTTIVLDARRGPYSGPVVLDTTGLVLTSTRGRAVLVGTDEPVVTLRADATAVRRLNIQGASVALVVEGTGCRVKDVRARGGEVAVLLSGSGQGTFERLTVEESPIGIDVSASSGNLFRGVVSRGCDETGIRLRKARANEFRDVSVDGAPTGVSVGESEDNVFVGLRVAGASIVGYEVLGGRGNALEASRIRTSRVGAVLEETDENRILDCVITAVEDAGISLVGARRSRLERDVVGSSAGDGVRFAGGRENAFVDGRLSRCRDAAIRIDASDANLIARNRISDGKTGIALTRSSEGRLLGNTIVRADTAGILLAEAHRNRLLDNRIDDSASGVVLVGAIDNSVLRSVMNRCRLSGVVLANHCQGNNVIENAVSETAVGILTATSSRDTIQGNRVSDCDVGVSLYAPGFGVRVVGNRLVGNEVGLRWQEALSEEDTVLPLLGISLVAETPGGAPIVQNNLFERNRLHDVKNETAELLYAGGNRWINHDALVSGNIHLPDTAWKGTIVVAAGRDLVDLVLGQALEVVLSEAGFRVVDLSGLGTSEELLAAMDERDVNIAWWVGAAPPPGTPVYWSVPTDLRWDLIVPGEIARGLGEPSISAFARSRDAEGRTIAVPAEISDDAVARFTSAYGVPIRSLRRTATPEEAEALLKFGSVSAALLENVEETATVAGFVRLEDDAFALPGRPIGVLVGREDVRRFPEVEQVFAKLSAHLTERNLRSMASRVRLLHREPLDVVMEFLGNEGLIQ
ncbi:MAG: right-handed parallel beta-helix repeat-containing protein [Candidatus Bipolaricaulota bacterium]|nr:right-handed parallel beta-helix repeat-containing protein [Candidatus Bipolaricaulota bacterium]